MNQRIRELLPKPWTFPYPDREMYSKEQMEEIAELIIKKCISQIALIGISNFENEDISWTVETAIANIKEHFGVEE